MKIIACLLVLISCSACVSVSNRYAPSSITKPDTNSGVVILSAGADKSCASSSSFLEVVGSEDNSVKVQGSSLGMDAFTIKSDFKDHYGFVHALTLPVGSYYIGVRRANALMTQDFKKTAKFTISPGKYTYIGEFYLTTSCETKIDSVIRDQFDRDIAFAKQKNNVFQNVVIDKKITKWQ